MGTPCTTVGVVRCGVDVVHGAHTWRDGPDEEIYRCDGGSDTVDERDDEYQQADLFDQDDQLHVELVTVNGGVL